VFVKAARSDIVAKFQIYFDRAVAQLGSQTFGDQESRQVALQVPPTNNSNVLKMPL